MKKLFCMVLVLAMVMGMASFAMADAAGDYKIAILTGTVSQGEEEFRAAEREIAKYGAQIITDTYPDQFMAEMETTVSKIVAFAADPAVKAIVVCQAVPGTKAAFDKIKEMGRDDILLIAGVPQEDPAVIAATADIVLYADEAKQGNTIMDKCDDWDIDVFIHYSFPRHMAMELIVARHQVLTANAEALDIEFVDVTAPDPTAEAGLSASQQFILEDVPKQMEKYEGKKVAFFTTNCGMQPSLQQAVLEQPAAYYPQPCCPSPYHAFPGVLGLELAIGDDDNAALQQIATKLDEVGAVDRFSTWASPLNMTLIEVGCNYARDYIEGKITSRNDTDVIVSMFNESVAGAIVDKYENVEGEVFDNYYVILLPAIDFSDYL